MKPATWKVTIIMLAQIRVFVNHWISPFSKSCTILLKKYARKRVKQVVLRVVKIRMKLTKGNAPHGSKNRFVFCQKFMEFIVLYFFQRQPYQLVYPMVLRV